MEERERLETCVMGHPAFWKSAKDQQWDALTVAKNVWVLGCDCIVWQRLEQAEVRAAVNEDMKRDITCRGDDVKGHIRNRGWWGERAGRHKIQELPEEGMFIPSLEDIHDTQIQA